MKTCIHKDFVVTFQNDSLITKSDEHFKLIFYIKFVFLQIIYTILRPFLYARYFRTHLGTINKKFQLIFFLRKHSASPSEGPTNMALSLKDSYPSGSTGIYAVSQTFIGKPSSKPLLENASGGTKVILVFQIYRAWSNWKLLVFSYSLNYKLQTK